jgi:ribulose-5-phosphate 4-epimerase/fuculose-1-phosphate aldolase
MRRHGATVVGRTLEELAFRTIYIARNAALQIQTHALGEVSPLDAEESRHLQPAARAGRARLRVLERAKP